MITLRPTRRTWAQLEEPIPLITLVPEQRPRTSSGLAVVGTVMSLLFLTTIYVRILTDGDGGRQRK